MKPILSKSILSRGRVLVGLTAGLACASHILAQGPTNLVVSRQTFDLTGQVANLQVGDVLPNGTLATASGIYTNTAGTSNVWMNESPDASFGVTAPIWLDNVNPATGSRTSSFNVTAATAGGTQITNSFPSKSELSLNLTPDGTGVTFMSYVAPVGELDASNGNTLQANDNTNPVASVGLVQRAIGQVSLNNFQVGPSSTVQVTPVNAYSGNNGRAAILGSDGNYYMAGNAGNGGWKVEADTTSGSPILTVVNGSGTTPSTFGLVVGQLITGTGIPAGATVQSIVDSTHFTISANATATSAPAGIKASIVQSNATLGILSNNTGIQMIADGSTGNTTVVGVAKGTFGSSTGYQNGFSITDVPGITTPDKTGKDDNFRGLTLNPFNNTLYTTKGSGSNGINTVYQIGSGLPGSNAASTSISILPGFPTALAGGSTSTTSNPVMSPFGLFFAAPNVLYVGDEGSADPTGITLDKTTYAGLQKWINSKADGTGTWTLAYVLQGGLNLGVKFSVPNDANGDVYPTSLDPANAGLRNIAGWNNEDGTITIYGVTATTSTNTDQGADPNQLVEITDSLGATSLPTGENFSVLETAQYGEVLRGVVATPEPGTLSLLAFGAAGFLGFRRRR